MTKDQQDAILAPTVMAYRLLAGPTDETCGGYRHLIDDASSFRAALRLDDPVLDDLIAQGVHKQPWSSEVARV